jgi:hypothetical protein
MPVGRWGAYERGELLGRSGTLGFQRETERTMPYGAVPVLCLIASGNGTRRENHGNGLLEFAIAIAIAVAVRYNMRSVVKCIRMDALEEWPHLRGVIVSCMPSMGGENRCMLLAYLQGLLRRMTGPGRERREDSSQTDTPCAC